MKIAVIPARGGSKRIPRKNIKDFCGKPMIAWSIEAALASGLFDRIIVSTDDAEIMTIAQAYGAEVPFLRPAELSDDHAGTGAVVKHAVERMIDEGLTLDAVCCIYPTAPLIQVADLSAALDALQSGEWDYAFVVAALSPTVFRSFQVAETGGLRMLFPHFYESRSQDLPKIYHDAGQFYWGRPSAWLGEAPVFGARSTPIIIPAERVQDIDTAADWDRCERVFLELRRQE